jgi:hypothetical protein
MSTGLFGVLLYRLSIAFGLPPDVLQGKDDIIKRGDID